jgi:hypothetical protein
VGFLAWGKLTHMCLHASIYDLRTLTRIHSRNEGMHSAAISFTRGMIFVASYVDRHELSHGL